MRPRFGEVSRCLGATFPLDQVLTSHAFGGQASLQRSWMHRELVRDGIDAALAGGEQSPGQLCHAFGQRRGARQVLGLKVFRSDRSVSGSALSMRLSARRSTPRSNMAERPAEERQSRGSGAKR
jgi:hypothetical protein